MIFNTNDFFYLMFFCSIHFHNPQIDVFFYRTIKSMQIGGVFDKKLKILIDIH